jgi:hypothetical protein
MKQPLQNLSDGKTVVEEISMPNPRAGMGFVKTAASLVSACNERRIFYNIIHWSVSSNGYYTEKLAYEKFEEK